MSSLFISLETAIKRLSISTHLKKQKNWKAKSKVQDAAKLYHVKAIVSLCKSSFKSHLFSWPFDITDIFEKLNQTQPQ
jgi:type III secretory pathway component EscU